MNFAMTLLKNQFPGGKADGDYVYSFSAEKEGDTAPRTLLAVVTGENTRNESPSDNRISDSGKKVNSPREWYWHGCPSEKKELCFGVVKNKKNEPYIVLFVVNRATNEVTSVDVINSVNTKTEAAGSLSPDVPDFSDYLTASEISISNLLDLVNFNMDLLVSRI